jgi:glycosyltransferase involved in cell wall biosynthesis
MLSASIIIATRNRCELLPRAIESARRAGTNVEIIVIDDASEDRTREVCAPLISDGRVRYFRLSRQLGLAGARNVGLISSTAPYITFLDDDDLRLPNSLDQQLERMEANPEAGMIYGKAFYGNEAGPIDGSHYPAECPAGDLFWNLLSENFIPCPTALFRRECLKRVGLLEQDAPGIEDWDLWVRIAELYPVLATEEPVAVWRKPTSSSRQFTSAGYKLHREAFRLLKNKWLRLPRALAATNEQRRSARRAFVQRSSQQLIWEATDRFTGSGIVSGLSAALAGVSIHPLAVSRKFFALPNLSRGFKKVRSHKAIDFPS